MTSPRKEGIADRPLWSLYVKRARGGWSLHCANVPLRDGDSLTWERPDAFVEGMKWVPNDAAAAVGIGPTRQDPPFPPGTTFRAVNHETVQTALGGGPLARWIVLADQPGHLHPTRLCTLPDFPSRKAKAVAERIAEVFTRDHQIGPQHGPTGDPATNEGSGTP